jgi:N-methylhydantoinase A
VHRVSLAAPPAVPPAAAAGKPERRRRVLIDPAIGPETAAVYARAGLAADAAFAGPAIVEQSDTTTVVPGGWRCRVAGGGVLVLEPIAPRPYMPRFHAVLPLRLTEN